MKTITTLALLSTVLAVFVLVSGCEEQGLNSTRRSRLVGDENLKLKKQLEVRDREIQKLKEVVAEYETESQKRADGEKEAGEMILKLLRESGVAGKKIEKLTEENLQLKAKIAELES